ncbi:RING-H2 finger protein ATL5-like [Durio zibethinus]|uniref:RING-type E3 ubiquitin transferase n=1 Tax=Durio zibethinus TaxID=66656 RepID=A0A6P5YMM1_DURZI|nr:RING-H2 finger protein ATL5-like [Durio zibethinus]
MSFTKIDKSKLINFGSILNQINDWQHSSFSVFSYKYGQISQRVSCISLLVNLLMIIIYVIELYNELRRRSSNRLPQDIERQPSEQEQEQQQQQQDSRAIFSDETNIVINNNQATNCAKCLEEFNDEEDDCRVCFKCKHQYHRLCINQWLAKEKHCPLCHPRVPALVVALFLIENPHEDKQVIFNKRMRRTLGLQRIETGQRQSNQLLQAMQRRQPSQCAVCLEEFKDDDEEDCRSLAGKGDTLPTLSWFYPWFKIIALDNRRSSSLEALTLPISSDANTIS